MSMAILDIDFDFFFDSDAPLTEFPKKSFWCDPKKLELSSLLQLTCVVEHHEVMMHLDAEQLRGTTYYHLDAHHDMYIEGSIEDLVPGTRAGFLKESNYLACALRDGLISRLYSVCPDWQSPEQREAELRPHLGAYGDRVVFIRFSDVKEALAGMTFDRGFCSLSPSFTPPDYFASFSAWSKCSPELLERAQDSYECSVIAQYPGSRFKFFYTLPSSLPHDIPCLYHGSRTPDLDFLQPGEGGILYLSPSPGFASCFGVQPTNDAGWIHGVDNLTGAHPFVYMIVPENQLNSLNQPIYLYRVSKPDSDLFEAGCVNGFEYGSHVALPVKSCEFFPSADDALAQFGVRVIREQSIPFVGDGVLIQRAKEHKQQIEDFFEMPLDMIQRLDHMFPLVYAYLISVAQIPPGELNPVYRFVWKNILERIILPTVFLHSDNNHNGYHGMDHCHDVALAACYLSLMRNQNPLPALLAGAVHDICQDNLLDEDHGEAASRRLSAILKSLGPGYFDGIDQAELAVTIKEHSEETPPTTLTSAFLRDADRLRLAWERGFDPKFFITEEGMEAARLGRYYLLASIENVFSDGILEVKAEVTNQCNLACSFCHQGFGVKKAHDRLMVDEFRQVLISTRESGVNTIRITGGEPCMHPDFERLLELAKEFGMNVVLNTNGTAKSLRQYLEFANYIDVFKISLPFGCEEDAVAMGQSRSLFRTKLELLATLYAYGHSVEALTIMTPLNIHKYDAFVELLDPLSGIRWVPLRAEPSELDRRPVSRENIRQVAEKILQTRQFSGERWSDLQLHLAVPFCVLDDNSISPIVFAGRRTCGPIQSLTVTPENQVISCYSEREELSVGANLQNTAWRSPHRYLDNLPDCCRSCIHCYLCMGGCITTFALEKTPFGSLDYLANPASIGHKRRHINA